MSFWSSAAEEGGAVEPAGARAPAEGGRGPVSQATALRQPGQTAGPEAAARGELQTQL